MPCVTPLAQPYAKLLSALVFCFQQRTGLASKQPQNAWLLSVGNVKQRVREGYGAFPHRARDALLRRRENGEGRNGTGGSWAPEAEKLREGTGGRKEGSRPRCAATGRSCINVLPWKPAQHQPDEHGARNQRARVRLRNDGDTDVIQRRVGRGSGRGAPNRRGHTESNGFQAGSINRVDEPLCTVERHRPQVRIQINGNLNVIHLVIRKACQNGNCVRRRLKSLDAVQTAVEAQAADFGGIKQNGKRILSSGEVKSRSYRSAACSDPAATAKAPMNVSLRRDFISFLSL